MYTTSSQKKPIPSNVTSGGMMFSTRASLVDRREQNVPFSNTRCCIVDYNQKLLAGEAQHLICFSRRSTWLCDLYIDGSTFDHDGLWSG